MEKLRKELNAVSITLSNLAKKVEKIQNKGINTSELVVLINIFPLEGTISQSQ